MLLALTEESWILLITSVGGGVIVVVLAVMGAYVGSVRGVGDIKVDLAKNHGETQTDLAGVKTSLSELRSRVEMVAEGRSPHIAEIRVTLGEHEKKIAAQDARITSVEHEIAACPVRIAREEKK